MSLLNATALAATLGVSKARVSQYVSEGKLDGCFSGNGQGRRFDLARVAEALGRKLDPGQMLGNGAETRRTLRTLNLQAPGPAAAPVAPAAQDADPEDEDPAPPARRSDGELARGDADRYELARIQKTEEEARKLRRINAEAEGALVLRSEVERQVARLMAQEVAEFESVLRTAARQVADAMAVDARAVRQILIAAWRAHRAERTEVLDASAATARMTAEEQAQDF